MRHSTAGYSAAATNRRSTRSYPSAAEDPPCSTRLKHPQHVRSELGPHLSIRALQGVGEDSAVSGEADSSYFKINPLWWTLVNDLPAVSYMFRKSMKTLFYSILLSALHVT